MFDRIFESWAARSDPRVRAFVDGKAAYESFIDEQQTRFDEMTETFYRRARLDPRMSRAAEKFILAIEMSERQHALSDAAVARYQLGLVLHAQGDFARALSFLRYALQTFNNLPQLNRGEGMSSCHYHIGILLFRLGDPAQAVREIEISRQLDEFNRDFSGVQLCDLALQAFSAAGANSRSLAAAAGWTQPGTPDDWVPPEPPTIMDDDNEATPNAQAPDKVVYFNQREVIVLASYSVEANDRLMAHLDSLKDTFGRPVTIIRVALGAADPSHRTLDSPDPDQHVCAVILVMERAGLHDPQFQSLIFTCKDRVVARSDFRLLVFLHDLTVNELQDLADREPYRSLLDTTQIAQSPSLEQVERSLVHFIRHVERVRMAAAWRTIRLRLARSCGGLATSVLVAASALALVGYPVWFFGWRPNFLGDWTPAAASFLLGLLAFPLQSPLLFLIVRGIRAMAAAPTESAMLRRWSLLGLIVMLGASHSQQALDGPHSWLILGLIVGVLLDAIRRGGHQARRQSIRLADKLKSATDADLRDPSLTVLRGDRLNPFSCPLVPALSARVFISYTRSSARGSRFAESLRQGLRAAGARPFLDRVSVPSGANWGRALDQHIGDCDVFVSILDEKAVQSEWVAAEVLTALEARQLTGAPHVLLLLDPLVLSSEKPMLPIFQGGFQIEVQHPRVRL